MMTRRCERSQKNARVERLPWRELERYGGTGFLAERDIMHKRRCIESELLKALEAYDRACSDTGSIAFSMALVSHRGCFTA